MAFPKGKSNPNAGRPAGSVNKRTEEAQALAARLGFNPLEILAHFAMGNWQALGYTTATKTITTADGDKITVDRIDEHLRQKSAKDALPYLHPQLKSVELTGEAAANAFASFTQMVAAMQASKSENSK